MVELKWRARYLAWVPIWVDEVEFHCHHGGSDSTDRGELSIYKGLTMLRRGFAPWWSLRQMPSVIKHGAIWWVVRHVAIVILSLLAALPLLVLLIC